MARKYYRNNESKEEDKRIQYFSLRELKLQTVFFCFFPSLRTSFFHFFFLNLVHVTKQEQGIMNTKGTRKDDNKKEKIKE